MMDTWYAKDGTPFDDRVLRNRYDEAQNIIGKWYKGQLYPTDRQTVDYYFVLYLERCPPILHQPEDVNVSINVYDGSEPVPYVYDADIPIKEWDAAVKDGRIGQTDEGDFIRFMQRESEKMIPAITELMKKRYE